ncbi:MAG: NnrS family protein [Sphingomonas sp.]|nr:NnrS family protein [Sphingomonas sp.]
MLALRRAREAAAPPILRGGFRPFFLGAAVWAVAAIILWVLALTGRIALPSAFDALAWHRHEMLFGFVAAAIAGFQLTAIPNWTGRFPVNGPPLAALFGLWLAGRIAVLFSAVAPLLAAAVDAGFFLVLAMVALPEVIAAKGRSLPTIILMVLLGTASLLDHWAGAGGPVDPELPFKLAIAIVTLMMALVGGRIIPSFTRNWMARQRILEGQPGQPGRFDKIANSITILAFAGWLAVPQGPVTAALFGAAALSQASRLARWKGWKVARDPLLLVLHLGYAWIAVGLALMAMSQLGDDVPRSAAVHALTAGAMGTLILAVMTRSSLSMTARKLEAGPATILIYVLVTLGAVLRLAAATSLLDYRLGIEAAAIAWGAAFLLFIFTYGPILFAPRLGEKG